MTDMKTHIAYKQEKGIKLTKKECRFLEEEAKKELEAKKKAEEEAKKLTKSEALLTEIVELLKNK